MSTIQLKARRRSFSVGKALIYLLLGVFALTIVVAFWHLLNLSLSPSYIATKGGLLLYPKALTWDNYSKVISNRTSGSAIKTR